ncbi:MAG: glycosyltransferase, partial [Verrucomicrobia bacterium]|nr:glycosyltransferase [Verrucomicrobiota bacterium]
MRADLHLHSRYSDRSAEWLFRRFDFPDSYSDPRALLLALRERGMDFFTLTDHNRIDGCLEMRDTAATADGDDAAARIFLSEEVTAYFPDDRCKVHLLVWGLNETQHREIRVLRENIFELQAYLAAQELAHAVAHPLFSVNQKLGAAHVEKLVLLFRTFEGINGLRDDLFNAVARDLLAGLTPEKIAAFANRHDLAPTHAEPWKKCFTAGSDDHGGMFPAHAWTETPAAKSAAEFLAGIRAGRATPHGQGGTPLALSHGLYNTAYAFAKDKLLKPGAGVLRKGTPPLLEKMFSRFMEGENPTQFSFAEKLNFLADGVLSGRIFELMKPGNASLWKELAAYFSQPEVKKAIERQTAGVAEPERRAFLIANLFTNQLAYRFFVKFVRQVSGGNMIEGLQAISAVAPLGLLLSPYIYSFRSQSPDRPWLRALSVEISGAVAPPLRNVRRAWFTDTLEDVNGVATTIRRMAATAKSLGHDLTVVTSRSHVERQLGEEIPLKNFPPIGEFEIPEYELQKLTFPPMLEMIDYIQREKFTELIISTPGPVGITALLAAKALHLRAVGIYHTDFPQYVQLLTDDHFMESLAWRFMYWFYHQLDGMFVNSEEYRRIWIDRGIDAGKIAILPRGLDTELFHPTRRAAGFWRERGARAGEVVLLYVGRISKEKNLEVFAAAHDLLRAEGLRVRAALVGDGVHLPEMRRLLPDAIFTGTLAGKELARAYASADVFVFPSVSDTFGNVVIEAQASGLPVVVSDQKGPQELVEEGVTGFVTRGLDPADL